MAAVDRDTYSPFILIDKSYQSLLLNDEAMARRQAAFEQCGVEGWNGSGYDWVVIARSVIASEKPELRDKISFDPEAGMFSAQGSIDDLVELAKLLHTAYHDEAMIQEIGRNQSDTHSQ